ncbi:MAG: 1-acyl-sn-glycerol-3-phosphate acyltransferase [Salaquimonas sp.]|nr:1-acyl-sn-glycerol-3-phosphate acyltransferase [Salaquimonas sp.]
MIALRSLLFILAFYSATLIQMIFWTPVFFFLPRKFAWHIPRLWAKSLLVLQHWIIGSRYEFRGLENIPRDRPFIVAAKHQSSWETYTGLLFLDDPSYILKRELMFIPLFGWYAAKMRVVPVNRGRRGAALADMAARSREQYHQGRKIIIYPEGTRTTAGEVPHYKYGITHLYRELDATILPVAVNSGLFWPRKSFRIYPGTITMEFLPVIEPGLGREAFAEELQNRIEGATTRLIAEIASGNNPPPLARKLAANRTEPTEASA